MSAEECSIYFDHVQQLCKCLFLQLVHKYPLFLQMIQLANLHLPIMKHQVLTVEQCHLIYPTLVYTNTLKSDALGQVSKLINERDKLRAAVVSLGVLMGVLVILLAVVITGWVWTCWKMKRYKATDTTQENLR